MHKPDTGVTVLLIDGDNVSADVIEQAVALLLDQHGALHVRRAWGTAESAVKHQGLFKRLGIRPMVNLASGKNATDIALAIDAVDLALALRPRRVVIASSDSDFEPLVVRLRELGCEVLGIGQDGKTGVATRGVYDGFTVISHRSAAERKAAAPSDTRRGRSAGRAAGRAAGSPGTAPAVPAAASPSPAPSPAAAAPAALPAAAAAAAKAPDGQAPARKTRRGGRKKTATPSASEAAASPPALVRPDKVNAIVQALPALAAGETLSLRSAAEKLRDAGVLGKRASSTRLFGQYPLHFELSPEGQPTRVRLKP